jgi:hypothetical protein
MSNIVFSDETDEPLVDLDDHLRIQFGPFERVTSMPLFTITARDTAVTIIRVTHKLRTRHQLYAIDEGTWTLTGIFGLYVDAMQELLRWRRYLNNGGTVTGWLRNHGDLVTPERSGLA